MSRDEMIDFLVKAIEVVEGVQVAPQHFEKFNDGELYKEVEWYDYLLGK